MIKFLWKIIFGKCKINCDSANAEAFLDIVKNSGIPFDKIVFVDGEYITHIAEKDVRLFVNAAEQKGLEYNIRRLRGIPFLFHKYRRRPGIIIGMVIFFAIILYSGRIIWDFEITGNEYISDTEIIEALEGVGCRAGASVSDMNFALIQNNCLIDAKELAWVSVNMDGNLARVEVREKRAVDMEYIPVKGRFANIIAAEDGVVEQCNVKRGKAAVEKGDVVKKGELLISGVIDVGETGVRYEYADGEVFASVYREIESFVPFLRTVSEPTGEKTEEIQLKIFGKVTNLSPRGRIDYKLYGKIIEKEKLSLPFDISLPVWMTRTVYSELHEKTVSLTEAEARFLAENEVSAKLKDMSDSFQVLSVSREIKTEDTGVRVTLGVYGVTDISANYGFSVSDNGAEGNEEQ